MRRITLNSPLKNISVLALLALLAQASTVLAQEKKLAGVEVFPKQINLNTLRDYQSLVVQARYTDGVTQDVTEQAKYAIANAKLVKQQGNVFHPVADGKTEIIITFAGQTLKVPVDIKDATKDRPISFKLDVMPIFMKSGCNTGSCHGAARGKDGFRLSLFGYDPDGDWHRITRQMSGRRISIALPEECMLVEKSLGTVEHTGGELFKAGSPRYDAMIRWLKAGAPKDGAKVAKPISMEILPSRIVLEGKDATQRMTVRAKYSDGTDRDVTALAQFSTNNETSANVDGGGLLTAKRRGEAYVFARFATFTEGAQAIIIPKGVKYTWPNVTEHNYIDKLVFNKLKKLRIVPSGICSDDVFMRRAYLDIAGIVPTTQEYKRFTDNKDPKKRDKLVDELLGRKEFSEIWVMKWAELLQIRSDNNQRMSYKSTLLYFNWLQDKIANNVPFDKMVQELLGASGGTFTNPATNYYQIETNTLKTAENVAQVFMGMRIQCAQCHNHPFDRWTMDDYYSFSAFFSQVGRKKAEDPREQIIYNRGGGDVKHPVGNRVMTPKFLGGAVPNVAGKDRRQILANWLASKENPYFARNLANIVWGHFYGQGIIEPVDDVRVSNPPSNPELLDELAKKFTEYNYDFKKIVRDICTSRTYQLSTQANATNESDTRNFTKGPIRRVRAEVLLDVISQITDTRNKFKGLPLGARAVQIADGNVSTYFLQAFGRASRETVCSCEVKMEPNLSQALHLLNGNTVNSRITQGAVVKKMLDAKKTPQQIIEQLYITALTRKPTSQEMEKLLAEIKTEDAKLMQQNLEDVFWALMNSKEFIFNH
jgi:hypothetical protein